MTTRPPRWADWVLRTTLPPRDRDAVSGDLLEEFRDTVVASKGPFRAKAWYIRQVAGYLWRLARVPALVLLGSLVLGFVLADAVAAAGILPRDFNTAGLALLAAALAPALVTLLSVGAVASHRARSFWAGAIAGGCAALVLTTILAIAAIAGTTWWQALPGPSESSALLRFVALGTLVGAKVSALGGLIGWAACRHRAAPRQGSSA